MGVTLPENDQNNQAGIWLGLDSPVSEPNPTSINWIILDSLETALLEPEVDMDLGEDSLHEYPLDRDMGSVTPCDSSRPQVYNRAPCKQMPNFGDSKTGQSRALLTVAATGIECEEVETSRTDCPYPGP